MLGSTVIDRFKYLFQYALFCMCLMYSLVFQNSVQKAIKHLAVPGVTTLLHIHTNAKGILYLLNPKKRNTE